jgi:lysophospholipase L1-like esterase
VKRLSFRIAAATLATLASGTVALAMLEVAARRHPAPGLELLARRPEIPQDCYRSSPTLWWEPVPGACGTDRHGLLLGEASGGTDPGPGSLVLPSDPGAAPGEELRLLVIGDSVAHLGLWVSRLGRDLADRAGRPVRLLNAGVVGYDTCQEATVLDEKGLGLQPDLVLVQVCPNDLSRTPFLVPEGRGLARFHLGASSFVLPSPLLHSRAITQAALLLGLWWSDELTPDAIGEDLHPSSMDASVRWFTLCASRIGALSERDGVPALFVLFPVLVDGEDRAGVMEAREDALRSAIPAAGLEFFDLRPPLVETGPLARLRPSADDVLHPDAAGQQVIGELLSAELCRRGLVAGCAPPYSRRSAPGATPPHRATAAPSRGVP